MNIDEKLGYGIGLGAIFGSVIGVLYSIFAKSNIYVALPICIVVGIIAGIVIVNFKE